MANQSTKYVAKQICMCSRWTNVVLITIPTLHMQSFYDGIVCTLFKLPQVVVVAAAAAAAVVVIVWQRQTIQNIKEYTFVVCGNRIKQKISI